MLAYDSYPDLQFTHLRLFLRRLIFAFVSIRPNFFSGSPIHLSGKLCDYFKNSLTKTLTS